MALGGAKRTGQGWSCKCPAHTDKTNSFSVTPTAERILWHCHAGCTQDEVMGALLRLKLVDPPKDARERERLMRTAGDTRMRALKVHQGGKQDAAPLGKIVATYDYVDINGQLLFQSLRFEPKTFRQRRPKGAGWEWTLGNTKPILYRLSEVITADTVFVLEGEKDVDALREWGLVGTCNPMGAGKFKTEMAQSFAGKHIIIIEDNDDAGQAHAQQVAEASHLHGAKSIRIVRLPGLKEHEDFSDWKNAGGTLAELKRIFRNTSEWKLPAAAVDDRPLIRVQAGKLDVAATEAAEALADATFAHPFEGVYRRVSLLVRPSRLFTGAELQKAGVKRSPGTLTIMQATDDFLAFSLTRHARWEKFDRRSDDWIPTNAPADVVKSLAAAADQLGHIPHLAGIVEAPTIRPDGTLLDQPGYDAVTGLLFDPGGVEFPSIPEKPTQAQAEAALDVLRALFVKFPFVDDASKAVILSQIITILTRKAMRAAPLFVISAPKMASGKTLLATVASYIATGRPPALMSQADNPESERKRLLAVLLEGASMVVIDNVERPVKSDALCSILTEPLFTDRLLGLSKTATAPTNTTFVVTGNNLVIAGDLTARAIVCSLDPACERPEERRFEVNLHDYVPQHRTELVAAALTIVRAYIAAGEPKRGKLANFARFEDWSRFAREPLVWLGMSDPCDTRKQIEARDPVREQLTGLLAAWHGVFATTPTTVAQVIEAAEETGPSGIPGQSEPIHPALHEVVRAIADERGRLNPRRLGNFIASHADRIEAGKRFERAGSRQGVVLWSVGLVGSMGRFQTNAGDCQSNPNRKKDKSIDAAETDPPNPRNPPRHSPRTTLNPEEILL